jgi:hypothetical protein
MLQNDNITEAPIRNVQIMNNQWTRKRTIPRKKCMLKHMNLNAYVLNEPSEKHQYNNVMASRIMGFLILGPAIIFSTNGFNVSLSDIGSPEQKFETEITTPKSNAFDMLSMSDNDDDE